MAGAASPTQPRGARASGFLSSHLSSRALHGLLRVVGPMCVCCMLRHRSCVASCVWRLCRDAQWLTSTTLRACCSVRLSVARCCCTLSVGCAARCLPSFALCLLHAACCLLPVVRCTPSVVFSTLSVLCCMLPVARCMLRYMSFAIRCMLHEVWRMLPVARCMSLVVRGILPGAWRMSSGCCLSHTTCRRLHFLVA